MAKTCIGIEIGASQLKMAVCAGDTVRKVFSEDMPDNMVKEGRIISPEAMAEFIRKSVSKHRPGTRKCAVILPPSVVFTQTLTLPVMTKEQLTINLPFEFRDFITQDKEKYFYDYTVTDAVTDEAGVHRETEYLAAAAAKDTVKSYALMFKRAGLKMAAAIPEEAAYLSIIRSIQKAGEKDGRREFWFIDLGHTAARIYIFRGVKLQASRAIETGMQLLDGIIADSQGVDEHIARMLKHANNYGELELPACRDTYASIAVEIMRAINFYRFNSPDSNLREVYLCGGGSNIQPLVAQISDTLEVPVHKVSEILPFRAPSPLTEPAVIGAAAQDGKKDSVNAINLNKKDIPPGYYQRILILGCALLAGVLTFTQFAVLLRVEQAIRAERDATAMEARYQKLVEDNAIYPSLVDEYEKYFTAPAGDSVYVDVMDVLRIVEEDLQPNADVSSLELRNNVLSLQLTGVNLEQASAIMNILMEREMVASVTIGSVNSGRDDISQVSMSVTLQTTEGAGQ